MSIPNNNIFIASSNSSGNSNLTQKNSKKKRNRLSLNCFNCKTRKIKCNRQRPCLSCIKKKLKCEYQRQQWLASPNNENNGIFQIQQLNSHNENSKITTSYEISNEDKNYQIQQQQQQQQQQTSELSQIQLLNDILKDSIKNQFHGNRNRDRNGNIENIELKKYIITDLFQYFIKYYYHKNFLKNLKSNLGLSDRPQEISKFESLLLEFEIYIDEKYSIINEYEIKMKFKDYINMKMILYMIYFYYYLYYEKKKKQLQLQLQLQQSLSYSYLKKILGSCINEFIPYLFELIINQNHNKLNDLQQTLGDTDKHTDKDHIVNPMIIIFKTVIPKVMMINFEILIRLNSSIYKLRYLNPHHNENLRDDFEYRLKFAKLNKLTQIYKKILEISLLIIAIIIIFKLNQKYDYQQKIKESYNINYILKQVFTDNTIPSNQTEYYYNNCMFNELSNDEINEITKILEVGLKKYTELKNKLGINTNFEDEHEDEHEDKHEHKHEEFHEAMRNHCLIELTSLIPVSNSSNLQQQQSLSFDDEEQDFNIMNNMDIDKFWSLMVQIKNKNKNNINDERSTNTN